ncbi:unnamed protein product [Sympodiomycopsis kandeliae]
MTSARMLRTPTGTASQSCTTSAENARLPDRRREFSPAWKRIPKRNTSESPIDSTDRAAGGNREQLQLATII